MECLYCPNLTENQSKLILPEEETKHVKALRLKEGEKIFLTNGKGTGAEGIIFFPGKKAASVHIEKQIQNPGEISRNVTLALGILTNKDRFEFALEKAVELGVKRFVPLLTERCQKKKVNPERLQAKAIAAMKQCRRGVLPEILRPFSPKDIDKLTEENTQVVLANEYGKPVGKFGFSDDVLLLIGPEGGFTPTERDIFERMGAEKISLGNRRLRAETAAISGISFACTT